MNPDQGPQFARVSWRLLRLRFPARYENGAGPDDDTVQNTKMVF